MQAKPDAETAAPAESAAGPPLETRRSDPSGGLGRARSNVRLSAHVRKLFGLMLALLFLLAFYGYRLYQKEIKPALDKVRSSQPVAAPVARAIEIQIPPETRRQLEEATAQIVALQKQLAETTAAQARQEDRLQTISGQLQAVKSAPLASSASMTSTADAAGVAAANTTPPALNEPPSSPGLAELRLMKERNRLSAYADEAISTGDRRSLNLLIEAMKDPARATFYHAARAEYYRIMGHYQLINRIDPAYKLPLAKLFPKVKIRDEADLRTDQIIALLHNQDIEWQSRLRAAYLLGGRRTPEVGAALLKALKEDANLDVAKEAQLSFEQNVGRNFLLFDITAIDTWWRAQMSGGPERKKPDPEN